MKSWICVLKKYLMIQVVLVALLVEVALAATTTNKSATTTGVSVTVPVVASLSISGGKVEMLQCDNVNKTITVSSAQFSPMVASNDDLLFIQPLCNSTDITNALIKRCDGQSSCKITFGSGSRVKLNGKTCSASWPLLVRYTCKLTFPKPGMENKATTTGQNNTSKPAFAPSMRRSMMVMELLDK